MKYHDKLYLKVCSSYVFRSILKYICFEIKLQFNSISSFNTLCLRIILEIIVFFIYKPQLLIAIQVLLAQLNKSFFYTWNKNI